MGVRFDFAGTVKEEDGKRFRRYQVQVNAGNKILNSIKQSRSSEHSSKRRILHCTITNMAQASDFRRASAGLQQAADELQQCIALHPVVLSL